MLWWITRRQWSYTLRRYSESGLSPGHPQQTHSRTGSRNFMTDFLNFSHSVHPLIILFSQGSLKRILTRPCVLLEDRLDRNKDRWPCVSSQLLVLIGWEQHNETSRPRCPSEVVPSVDCIKTRPAVPLFRSPNKSKKCLSQRGLSLNSAFLAPSTVTICAFAFSHHVIYV